MVAVCHSLQGMAIQYACSGPKNATARMNCMTKTREKEATEKAKERKGSRKSIITANSPYFITFCEILIRL